MGLIRSNTSVAVFVDVHMCIFNLDLLEREKVKVSLSRGRCTFHSFPSPCMARRPICNYNPAISFRAVYRSSAIKDSGHLTDHLDTTLRAQMTMASQSSPESSFRHSSSYKENQPHRSHPKFGHLPLSTSGPQDCALTGSALLNTPYFNKGASFPASERKGFKLTGLLPQHVSTLEQQVTRAYQQYSSRKDDLAKNTFMTSLAYQNQVLYFRVSGKALFRSHLESNMRDIGRRDGSRRSGALFAHVCQVTITCNSLPRKSQEHGNTLFQAWDHIPMFDLT